MNAIFETLSANPSQLVPITALLVVGILGIAGSVALVLISRHGQNTKLKQSMIERGMSAEEIERVITSKPS